MLHPSRVPDEERVLRGAHSDPDGVWQDDPPSGDDRLWVDERRSGRIHLKSPDTIRSCTITTSSTISSGRSFTTATRAAVSTSNTLASAIASTTAASTSATIPAAIPAVITTTCARSATCIGLRKVLDEVKKTLAFDIAFGNLLGIGGLEGHHHPLHPVDARARHIDHIAVKAGLRLIELQLLVDRDLRLLLGLAFGKEGGLLRKRVFQDKSGEFGKGFHSPRNLGHS